MVRSGNLGRTDDVFTLRVSCAAEERSKPTPFDSHWFPAFLAGRIPHRIRDRGIERRSISVDIDRMFAFGISRAAEKLSEASFSHGHRFTAQRAGDVRCLFFLRLNFAILPTREIHCIFAIGVIRAGQKPPILPPLDDHRLAALFADKIRRYFLFFYIAHGRFRFFEFLRECTVKMVQSVETFDLALFDPVKIGLQGCGKSHIEDTGEILDQ